MTTFTTQDRQDAQRTPLTDEEIRDIWYRHPEFKDGLGVEPITFARAIERAHGIGE